LMRTTTERPFRLFTTRTRVPKGSVLCAAVSACVLNLSPFAVRRPWNPGPYQEARPERVGPAAKAEPEPQRTRARAAEAASFG
jgi:hypothetical protein